MALDLSGRYYIDGMDLWSSFNIFVESGSDGFLKYPGKKESTRHDWMDSDGVEVDLSRIYFNPRDISLQCAIISESEADFWEKYSSFISLLKQPFTRRITIAEFGNQSFMVHYKECTNFSRFTRLKDSAKIACKFTLVLTEPEPNVDNNFTAIIDDIGRIIVT